MASSDSIWNDCLTRNTQRLLYEAGSVIFLFFCSESEFSSLLPTGEVTYTTSPWTIFYTRPLFDHMPSSPILNASTWIPHDALRLHVGGVMREDCQKVKEPRWAGVGGGRGRGRPGPITGSSKHMHTRLTACNKLKMTLYVFCSSHQAHPSIKIPSQGEQR